LLAIAGAFLLSIIPPDIRAAEVIINP
jgi:hypothetical protein